MTCWPDSGSGDGEELQVAGPGYLLLVFACIVKAPVSLASGHCSDWGYKPAFPYSGEYFS